MRSSTGIHFPALDHIRAMAAFMVFAWHFTHYATGYPVPFTAPTIPLLSIFDEGHTGVALFMTLSGFLFATILENRRIHYSRFLFNRLLRLIPLLIVVLTAVGLRHWWDGGDVTVYSQTLLSGFVLPVWPNGGWSIAVEIHFYLALPLLLWMQNTSRLALPLVVIVMILLRGVIWWQVGEIQSLPTGPLSAV